MRTLVALKTIPLDKLSVGDEVLYPNPSRALGQGTTGVITTIHIEADTVVIAWDNGVSKGYNSQIRATIIWFGPLIAEEIE